MAGVAGQQGELDLPPALKLDVLDAIERSLAGDDPEALRRALGEGGAALRDGVVEPFLAGFRKRKEIDDRLKQLTTTSLPAQPGAFGAAPAAPAGFGALGATAAMAAQAARPGAKGAEELLASAFSYTRLFTVVPGDPTVRTVAAHEDWARVGRPDLPGKTIPEAELAPVLALSSDVARTLRENLCRALQLVAAARAAAPGHP
ncbi:hypothetical protein T484DRAFT_1854779 [Baffinella frigidus]|nr:hypothetical protein T484DRAFT_1854779 [Cryptophyta sp. CCMP2293]